MAEAGQVGLAARRVDHHVVAVAELAERLAQPRPLLGLRLAAVTRRRALDPPVQRHRQVSLAGRRRARPVPEEGRQRRLPAVEIEGADPVAELQQGDRQVHGRRRLAGAALLVAERDDPGGAAAVLEDRGVLVAELGRGEAEGDGYLGNPADFPDRQPVPGLAHRAYDPHHQLGGLGIAGDLGDRAQCAALAHLRALADRVGEAGEQVDRHVDLEGLQGVE